MPARAGLAVGLEDEVDRRRQVRRVAWTELRRTPESPFPSARPSACRAACRPRRARTQTFSRPPSPAAGRSRCAPRGRTGPAGRDPGAQLGAQDGCAAVAASAGRVERRRAAYAHVTTPGPRRSTSFSAIRGQACGDFNWAVPYCAETLENRPVPCFALRNRAKWRSRGDPLISVFFGRILRSGGSNDETTPGRRRDDCDGRNGRRIGADIRAADARRAHATPSPERAQDQPFPPGSPFALLPGFKIERVTPVDRTESLIVVTFDPLGRPVVSQSTLRQRRLAARAARQQQRRHFRDREDRRGAVEHVPRLVLREPDDALRELPREPAWRSGAGTGSRRWRGRWWTRRASSRLRVRRVPRVPRRRSRWPVRQAQSCHHRLQRAPTSW